MDGCYKVIKETYAERKVRMEIKVKVDDERVQRLMRLAKQIEKQNKKRRWKNSDCRR